MNDGWIFVLVLALVWIPYLLSRRREQTTWESVEVWIVEIPAGAVPHRTMLSRAKNLQGVLEIRSVVIAVQAYAEAKGADEAAQLAVEVKLRAERKAGEFLRDDPEVGRGKSPKLGLLGRTEPKKIDLEEWR